VLDRPYQLTIRLGSGYFFFGSLLDGRTEINGVGLGELSLESSPASRVKKGPYQGRSPASGRATWKPRGEKGGRLVRPTVTSRPRLPPTRTSVPLRLPGKWRICVAFWGEACYIAKKVRKRILGRLTCPLHPRRGRQRMILTEGSKKANCSGLGEI
jgi:hypothetical protein